MPRGHRSLGNLHPALGGDKPKGKMTAYAFFVQTCREEHKRKFPDEEVNFADFARKCADRWKTMSEKEKRRFNQMAEEDKKRFEYEMAHYVPMNQRVVNAAENEEKRVRKKRKTKDPNAPKRCMSAFFWFSQDERPKVKAANPDFGVGDIAKELSRRWSETNPAVKAKFEAMAEKDRERYINDKRAYQEKLREEQSAGSSSASTSGSNKFARMAAAPTASSTTVGSYHATNKQDEDEEEEPIEEEEFDEGESD